MCEYVSTIFNKNVDNFSLLWYYPLKDGDKQMDIYDRIKEKRIELGMSQEDLAKKMGYSSRSSIAKVESGVVDISQSKIVAFAQALDTTPSYLMGWNEEKITSKELENVAPNAFRKMINVLGRIPAGEPNWVEQCVEGFDIVDDYRIDYALKVKGDSMINAGIFNGSIVYVQREADYNNGDIVIAVINGYDATVKKYYRYGDKILLKPENPTMKEIEYSVSDVALRGKVISAKIIF